MSLKGAGAHWGKLEKFTRKVKRGGKIIGENISKHLGIKAKSTTKYALYISHTFEVLYQQKNHYRLNLMTPFLENSV